MYRQDFYLRLMLYIVMNRGKLSKINSSDPNLKMAALLRGYERSSGLVILGMSLILPNLMAIKYLK
jgi:hypothetical protein